jgi:hypothetical protein
MAGRIVLPRLTLDRRRDWRERMASLMHSRAAAPFQWGVNDCLMFAADAVVACTGTDPAAELRGTYSDAMTARRMLEALGGTASICDDLFERFQATGLARLGDVGLMAMPNGREVAIVCGGNSWHAPAEEGGLAGYPFDAVQVAWRVGR